MSDDWIEPRTTGAAVVLATYVVTFTALADGRCEVAVRNVQPPPNDSVPHQMRTRRSTHADLLQAVPQMIADMEAMRWP